MSGKALAQLATVVIIVWCFVMLGLVGALWGALANGAGWEPVGIWLLPAAALFIVGQSLSSAAKRKGTNPTTWEPYPGGEAPAKVDPERRRFVMAALRQSLVDDPAGTRIAGHDLAAADGLLRSYYHAPEVNWGELWQAAARNRKLPPYGEEPYWAPYGPGGRPSPLTYLAFWDTADRLRVIQEDGTPEAVVELAQDDPDPLIRAAARLR